MKRNLEEYLNGIQREVKRKDCFHLVKIMEEESGYQASLCGKIVGFGLYHYRYESGREGDAIVTGFTPRSQDIALYIMPGFTDYGKDLEALGKHKSSRSCLYIRKLADIDESVLRKITGHSVLVMQERCECKS